ncbi:ELAV like protein 2/3/4 [Pelomyxa schiedti]|nr:ELAV like protein 2/3/4 [Pelomyxa schiedti]
MDPQQQPGAQTVAPPSSSGGARTYDAATTDDASCSGTTTASACGPTDPPPLDSNSSSSSSTTAANSATTAAANSATTAAATTATTSPSTATVATTSPAAASSSSSASLGGSTYASGASGATLPLSLALPLGVQIPIPMPMNMNMNMNMGMGLGLGIGVGGGGGGMTTTSSIAAAVAAAAAAAAGGCGDGGQEPNLIVNYLPSHVNEAQFQNMFLPFGKIVSCKVVVDKRLGTSLGYGFVRYETLEEAKKAILVMNGHALDGKVLKVAFARPPSADIKNTNLYVSGMEPTFTRDELGEVFSRFGKVIDAKILTDPKSGLNRGAGFVRFERRSDAEIAINSLNGICIPGMSNRGLVVKVADQSTEKASHSLMPPILSAYSRYNPLSITGYPGLPGFDQNFLMPQTPAPNSQQSQNAIFIYNLPADADDFLLYKLFSPFGAVMSVKVVKDLTTQKCKGYGFVVLSNVDEAQRAIMTLNGQQLGNKTLQVRFRSAKQEPTFPNFLSFQHMGL